MTNWLKYGLIVVFTALLIWAGSFLFNTITENRRLADNVEQLTNENTNMATTLTLTNREMDSFINVRYPALIDSMTALGIKIKNLTKVSVTNNYYSDTIVRNTDLTPVLDAITNNVEIVQPFIDSTSCLTIKGNIEYRDGKLNMVISDRIFSDTIVDLSFWQRRQWKFGFIRSRFLGRKEAVLKNTSNCGSISKTLTLQKKQ